MNSTALANSPQLAVRAGAVVFATLMCAASMILNFDVLARYEGQHDAVTMARLSPSTCGLAQAGGAGTANLGGARPAAARG